ncbi:hypothetical protein YA21_22810 [Klebsiella aerogenes]|nr:hypothetical protein YA21_22810 [Klebsiella aerogenes]KTJ03084.1 hypothetical protein ASU92_08545 [Klebsiella aerogenes]
MIKRKIFNIEQVNWGQTVYIIKMFCNLLQLTSAYFIKKNYIQLIYIEFSNDLSLLILVRLSRIRPLFAIEAKYAVFPFTAKS